MIIPILILYGIVFVCLLMTIFVNSKFYKDSQFKSQYNRIVKKLDLSVIAWTIILVITNIWSIIGLSCHYSQLICISFSAFINIVCGQKIYFLMSTYMTIHRWWYEYGSLGGPNRDYLLRAICVDDKETGDNFCDVIAELRKSFKDGVSSSIDVYDLFVNKFGFNLSGSEKFENFVKHFKREEILDFVNLYCNISEYSKKYGKGYSGVNHRLFREETGLNLKVLPLGDIYCII